MDTSMSHNMRQILATVSDAKTEISGRSVAAWLNKSKHPEGIREGLKALTKRGLIVMRPMDDPNDEFRQRFPDWLKAVYHVPKK